MLKKVINIFYLSTFIIFLLFTTKFYFSEKNIKNINRSKSSYTIEQNMNIKNIPLLKNDTSDIIVYKDEVEEFKKKKKRIWEKLLSD